MKYKTEPLANGIAHYSMASGKLEMVGFQKKAVPESPCLTCKHFSRGWRDTRLHPGEADECGHPELCYLMTANMKRGQIKICKGYEAQPWAKNVARAEAQSAYRMEEQIDGTWAIWPNTPQGFEDAIFYRNMTASFPPNQRKAAEHLLNILNKA